jgi:hypothetical protein
MQLSSRPAGAAVWLDGLADLTRPPEDHYYERLLSRYGQMRQFVPTLLRPVAFDGTAAGRPVLDALAFLRQVEGQRSPAGALFQQSGMSEPPGQRWSCCGSSSRP